MDAVASIVASLVQIILQFLPKDSPCPMCEARAKQPVQTVAAVEAANLAADLAEDAKFGPKK
jgi:hypothetical protein